MNDVKKTRCRACGAELEANANGGRPRQFCGAGCRRYMEHCAGRLDRLIETLTLREVGLRIPGRIELPTDREEHAFVLAEIAAAERRLRELLADDY